MKYAQILLVAAVILLPRFVYGQLPSWVDDSRREAMYPAAEWYTGFSVDALKSGANLAEVRKRVENEARNDLAKKITVRIQAVSTAHTSSQQTRTGGSAEETIRKNYGQMIQASTDTEVSGVETVIHHDQASNKIYALARVKKADLAAYYVSRIEFYLQIAENDLKLAKQYAESDRKRSALEKIEEARNNINECGKYNELLSAVDFKGDIKRLLDRRAALLRDIAEFETKLMESAAIFVAGSEIIDKDEADIIIPALQSKFSAGGCRVATSRDDASYILTVDVTNCLVSKDANFTYCYACVKADLVNNRTGKSEAKINFTGPKAAWTTQDRACRKAFEEAAEAMWKNIREKTEVCR